MTESQKKFADEIAGYVKELGSKYNIKVVSPIVAQAILESGWGTSTKAKKNNFFGLKYREGRVTCNNGTFVDGSSEQNPDGTYIPITDQWYSFETAKDGVEGYLQFINISRYNNLKNVTDWEKYIELIREDGYATSLSYVTNLKNVVKNNNLTSYDDTETEQEDTNMSNSSLVTYSNITSHKTSPRNHKIDTITIHCYVGQVTAKQGCDYFKTTTRSASSNYIVGKDGSVGLSVDEKDRAWTSSNSTNDNRAITIETACDTTAPYHVNDVTLNKLIELIADICRRNGIEKLTWSDNKDDRINHKNGCNMTVHRDFAATACPGDYLYSKQSYIADEVNKILGITTETKTETKKEENKTTTSTNTSTSSSTYTTGMYKVNVSELNIRKGPGTNYSIVGCIKDKGTYTITEIKNGSWGRLKSGAGWINVHKNYCTKSKTSSSTTTKTTASNKKSNEEIAREVLQGKWGNGSERKKKLEAAGYNYSSVQAIVNKLCK